jgi:hypothetical protein
VKAVLDASLKTRAVHRKGWIECDGQKNGYDPKGSEAQSEIYAMCTLHSVKVKISPLKISGMKYVPPLESFRLCGTVLIQPTKSYEMRKNFQRKSRRRILWSEDLGDYWKLYFHL